MMPGETMEARTLLDQYFADMYPKSQRSCSSTWTGVSTRLPFPDIFKEAEKSAALLTILQVNATCRPLVESIESGLRQCDVRCLPKLAENGMEEDDFVELKNFSNELTESFIF